jgi:hypothetical protein
MQYKIKTKTRLKARTSRRQKSLSSSTTIISSKKYAKYSFGTFPKSNRKIVERGKFDNPNAHFTFFIQHYNKKYKHLNE